MKTYKDLEEEHSRCIITKALGQECAEQVKEEKEQETLYKAAKTTDNLRI